MKMRTLGRTGVKISELCLGTMTWGHKNTEAEGHAQMDYAVGEGINFFDTAELYSVPPSAEKYGRTEEIIGTWFAARKNRKSIVLASKVAGPGTAWIHDGTPVDSKTIAKSVDASLKRLQTDYIDLYQIHWPNRPFPHFSSHGAGAVDFTQGNSTSIEAELLDILKGLDDAVKAGKIRYAGVSNETAWGTMKYLQLAEKHNLPRLVSVQNEFGILNRVDDPYVAEVCVREDVSYLPWSPLAGGLITGKYADGSRPVNARWSMDSRKSHRDVPSAHTAVAAYIDVAKKHGLDVCQMALAFCRLQSFVTSTIIGATSMEQLKADIASANLVLNDDVLADIKAVHRANPIPF